VKEVDRLTGEHRDGEKLGKRQKVKRDRTGTDAESFHRHSTSCGTLMRQEVTPVLSAVTLLSTFTVVEMMQTLT
jgi:hypothetical protein